MRLRVRSLALPSGLGSSVAMSCGLGCRHGSDPLLLWPWAPHLTVSLRPLKCSYFTDEETEAPKASTLPKMTRLLHHRSRAKGQLPKSSSLGAFHGSYLTWNGGQGASVQSRVQSPLLGPISFLASCEAGFPGCFHEKSFVQGTGS